MLADAGLSFQRTSSSARQRIYWIPDKLSANWTPDIRAYPTAKKIEELAPTPTYAGYLNTHRNGKKDHDRRIAALERRPPDRRPPDRRLTQD